MQKMGSKTLMLPGLSAELLQQMEVVCGHAIDDLVMSLSEKGAWADVESILDACPVDTVFDGSRSVRPKAALGLFAEAASEPPGQKSQGSGHDLQECRRVGRRWVRAWSEQEQGQAIWNGLTRHAPAETLLDISGSGLSPYTASKYHSTVYPLPSSMSVLDCRDASAAGSTLIWRRHGDLATLIEQGFLKGSQKQVPPAFTISTPGYLVTGRPLSLVDAAIMVTLDDRSAMSQDAGSGKDRQEALRPFKTILAVLDLLDEESPEVRASLGRSLETLYLLASIRVGVQRDAGAGVIRLNSIGSQIATLLMTRRAEIPETGIQLNLDRGSSVVQRPREWVAEDLMEAVCDTAASVPWLHVECGKAMDWCASLYRKGWIETPPEQAMGKLLHRAVKNNSIPIARFALDHGADLTVTGDTQTTHTMTPIQAARALKRPEILSMIQSDLAKQAIAGVFESALGAESSKGVIPGAAPGAELEPTPGAAEGGEPTRRQKSPKAR